MSKKRKDCGKRRRGIFSAGAEKAATVFLILLPLAVTDGICVMLTDASGWYLMPSDIPAWIWSACFYTSVLTAVYCMDRKTGTAVSAALPCIYGTASYFKEQNLGTPVLVSDLSFAGHAGGLMEMLGLSAVKGFVLKFGILLLILIAVHRLAGGIIRKKTEKIQENAACGTADAGFCGALLAFAAAYILWSMPVFGACVPWEEAGESAELYVFRNGVIGGIRGYALQSEEKQPDGYTPEKAEKLLKEGSEKAEMPAEWPAGTDVIFVLSEAYWNPEHIPGYSFSEDLQAPFDDLAAYGKSGNMLSPVYAGLTVNTEYELLTGCSLADRQEGYVAYTDVFASGKGSAVPSAVKLFSAAGYSTSVISPFDIEGIYNCPEAYGTLGFGKTVLFGSMKDGAEKENAAMQKRFVSDSYTFQTAEKMLTDGPDFMLVKTVGNHMPYYGNRFSGQGTVKVSGGTEEENAMLSQEATGSSMSAEAALKFWEDIRNSGHPTVMIFFGDHLPALTDPSGTDIAEKYWSTGSTDAEKAEKKYTVPYAVLSNFSGGTDAFCTDTEASPWKLGAEAVCAALGRKGSDDWFRYLLNSSGVCPAENRSAVYGADGKVYKKGEEPAETGKEISERRTVQWYVSHGGK